MGAELLHLKKPYLSELVVKISFIVSETAMIYAKDIFKIPKFCVKALCKVILTFISNFSLVNVLVQCVSSLALAVKSQAEGCSLCLSQNKW